MMHEAATASSGNGDLQPCYLTRPQEDMLVISVSPTAGAGGYLVIVGTVVGDDGRPWPLEVRRGEGLNIQPGEQLFGTRHCITSLSVSRCSSRRSLTRACTCAGRVYHFEDGVTKPFNATDHPGIINTRVAFLYLTPPRDVRHNAVHQPGNVILDQIFPNIAVNVAPGVRSSCANDEQQVLPGRKQHVGCIMSTTVEAPHLMSTFPTCCSGLRTWPGATPSTPWWPSRPSTSGMAGRWSTWMAYHRAARSSGCVPQHLIHLIHYTCTQAHPTT